MKSYMPFGLKFIHSLIIKLFGIPKLYKVLWYRWLANGADFVDIECTVHKIGRKYCDWGKRFAETAAYYLNLAHQAKLLGDEIGVRDYLLKVSLYYHLAQWGALDSNIRKIYYSSCVQYFKDALQYFSFTVEPISLQYQNKTYYGYFYMASKDQINKKPTILLIHGADSSKEELYYFGKEAVENGFNLLIIDGPGQGEALLYNNVPMFAESEKVYMKAIDYLMQHPLVDVNNIGVFGISFGGFWSIKLAAFDERIKACVALGAPYNPAAKIKKAPPPIWKICYQWKYLIKHALGHLKQTFVIALTVIMRLPEIFGASSREELTKIVADFTLEDIVSKVKIATLVINGNKDILCQPDEQLAIFEKLKGHKELRLLKGMDHCCSKLIKISLRRQIMWWFKKQLTSQNNENFPADEAII